MSPPSESNLSQRPYEGVSEQAKDERARNIRLVVCGGDGNPLHCVYLNDYRIAGGKPWGGGTTTKEWLLSFADIKKAVPDLFAEARSSVEREIAEDFEAAAREAEAAGAKPYVVRDLQSYARRIRSGQYQHSKEGETKPELGSFPP